MNELEKRIDELEKKIEKIEKILKLDKPPLSKEERAKVVADAVRKTIQLCSESSSKSHE